MSLHAKREQELGQKHVRRVTFEISRYGKHRRSLTFKQPVSVSHAIKCVERWLSQPISDRYLHRICDDCICPDPQTPGHCLGDAIFLEDFAVSPRCVLTFDIGS